MLLRRIRWYIKIFYGIMILSVFGLMVSLYKGSIFGMIGSVVFFFATLLIKRMYGEIYKELSEAIKQVSDDKPI